MRHPRKKDVGGDSETMNNLFLFNPLAEQGQRLFHSGCTEKTDKGSIEEKGAFG
jgi:hypothetical protein